MKWLGLESREAIRVGLRRITVQPASKRNVNGLLKAIDGTAGTGRVDPGTDIYHTPVY
jgi:hypothetical protein